MRFLAKGFVFIGKKRLMPSIGLSRSYTRAPALICGIPASGKSSYGRWLEREKNIIFVDIEEDSALESAGLEQLWDSLLADLAGASNLVQALTRNKRQIVLAWGFPVSYLPVVAALKDTGVNVWWFDGDRASARQSFLDRGDLALELFDSQLADIEAHWPEILRIFGTHIIQVVGPGQAYLPGEEIYNQMFS